MRVEAALVPCEIKEHDLSGKLAVVIDVFRFTTSVLTALEAGAAAFFPVAEPQRALLMKRKTPDLLLAGEQEALKIPGFDLGNSPLEHLGKDYRGKKLVFCTTNGTKAVHKAAQAEQVLLASLRNAEAVARYLRQQKRDVFFIPAGTKGKFSLEDVWCAGLILSYLTRIELGDGALTAKIVFARIALSQLKESEHGRNLVRLGFQADLEFCLQCNASSHLIVWDLKSGWGRLA